MLEWIAGGVRWRVSPLFFALVTVLLLRQPDGTVLLCLTASVMHEAGHLLMMLALGCPPSRCTVGVFGARIETDPARTPDYRRNVWISLAGPAVNAAAAGVLFAVGADRAALTHAVLGISNLLPAAALDGGQILHCLLCLHGRPDRVQPLLRAVSAAVLMPMAAGAFYLFLSGGNGTLLIVSGYLTALIFFRSD